MALLDRKPYVQDLHDRKSSATGADDLFRNVSPCTEMHVAVLNVLVL